MDEITFFIGDQVNPNVILDVTNMGWMLEDEFDLDLVAKECSDVDEYFDSFTKYTYSGDSKMAEIRGLYDYLKANDTDVVVQVTRPTRHGWIAGVLTKRFGCKFVYRYDTDAFYSYVPRQGVEPLKYFAFHNVLGRWPPKFADGCIVLGPNGKQRLVDRGVDQKRIGVLPPTINPNRLEVSEADVNVDHVEQDNVVLFIGRLNRMKGFEFLMDAIPEIIKKRDDIHFIIVGSGDKPSLDSELQNHVTFTGFVQPSSIGQYLNYADVLVLPSLREGLPRVILEGLYSNLAVIARSVGEVESVTNNTFSSKNSFINMVSDFENLEEDSVESYTISNQESKYVDYFNSLCDS